MSAMIVITCPSTGRDVNASIITEESSFASLPRRKMAVHCKQCGREHQWWIAEGRLSTLDDVRWPVPARIPQRASATVQPRSSHCA